MVNGLPDHLKGNIDLELRGSLGNLCETKSPKKAKQSQDSKVGIFNNYLVILYHNILFPKTIQRQRVNFGIGHHQVVHFSNGRETDCKDIITVSKTCVLRPQVN